MIRTTTSSILKGFARLGKAIRITPKAHCHHAGPGLSIQWNTDTIQIIIGIGKDHTATLIMDTDAHKALLAGEKVHVTTTEEYRKAYVAEPLPTPAID